MDGLIPRKVITMILSEREECFIDLISGAVHHAADPPARVVAYTPQTNDADNLFRTASRHTWDFAVLFLNNICYASGNRNKRAIANDSIDFVMKMVIVFDKPILALHGLNEGSWYDARLREAGATAVCRLPFALDDMVPALRKFHGISNR